jgi:superfamily I DNA/RNA helicase
MVTQNNYVAALVNGDQVIVKKIGAQENKCGLSFIQVEVEELFSKKTYELLLLEDILYSIGTNLNPKQHKDLMIDFFRRMQKKGIKQKDKMFKENMLKDAYLNALKAVFGYAITCHKSQGGEWDEVFLYLDNKIHGLGKPEIYQWWYTAVTRAKNNLHIVDDWFIN